MLRIDADRLLKSIDELGRIGRTKDGVTRLCLTPEEVEGRRYVFDLMKRAGLQCHFDEVANIIGILNNGANAIPVVTGSHTDSVINAGRLDGCYGVLSAIEAVRTIKESGLRLRHPLVAVCFTNEEGIRFPSMIGSKYLTGFMQLEEAYSLRDSNGITFREAFESSRFMPIKGGKGTFGKGSTRAFVELHIEQGPILEREKIKVGVVESIVGVTQYDVSILGSADHAGTTPLNMRKDAMLATSKMVLIVNALAREFEAVGTVGRVVVSPNAPNVVPGEVRFTIDFRHSSEEVLARARRRLQEMAANTSAETNVEISIVPRIDLKPAIMSPSVMNAIVASAKEVGTSFRKMPSGAGHDTMIMNLVTETGMIFVPSKGGKSHTPLESTEPEDLVNGANVLVNTLARLSS
jgi:hydantoinase/carbamoylase family amidase